MPSYLDRYRAGEHESVWVELTALGGRVRGEPLRADAWAVACETMRRVRSNVETLIPRLSALGWRLGGERWSDWRGPLTLPSHDAVAAADAVEAIIGGPIPLSVRAFYETVGGIDLRGSHPDWPDFYDPLMVASGAEVLRDLRAQREWQEGRARAGQPAVPFTLYYAPDFLVKENISGVGALSLDVPDPAADAPLQFEDGPMPVTFVQSLRNALRWGGFQGLVSAESGFDKDVRPPPTDLRALTSGLLPL